MNNIGIDFSSHSSLNGFLARDLTTGDLGWGRTVKEALDDLSSSERASEDEFPSLLEEDFHREQDKLLREIIHG